jgi:hypothetical protein
MHASHVCRQWHHVGVSEGMWQHHHMRKWGLPPSLRVLPSDGARSTRGISWRAEVHARIMKEPRTAEAAHRTLLPPALAAAPLPKGVVEHGTCK